MGGLWKDKPIIPTPVPRSIGLPQPREVATEPQTVTVAVIAFAVALITSLGVSIGCVMYLR